MEPLNITERIGLRKPVILLGIPVDTIDMEETLDRLDQFVVQGRATGKWHHVATANVDFLVKALSDASLRSILQSITLITADGMPVVWAARLLGASIKERVAGSDLVPLLSTRAAQKGYSIFFLGAAPHIATKAAEILAKRNPGLKIVGVVSPPVLPFDQMDHALVDQINAAKPDILLVAFGNPKQEKWIARNRDELNVPVLMGIGGTLDFITGNTKRAPRWMQNIGLEWVHRFIHEPRRLWKRYAVGLILFGPNFINQWANFQFAQPQSRESSIQLSFNGDESIIQVKGKINAQSLQAFRRVAEDALNQAPRLIVDLAMATFLDSSAVGTLLAVDQQAKSQGGELILQRVPSRIRNSFRLLKLENYFTLINTEDIALAEFHHSDGKNAVTGSNQDTSSPKSTKSQTLEDAGQTIE